MSYKIASPLASYTVDELVSSKAGPQGTAAYDEMVYDPIAQDRLSAEKFGAEGKKTLIFVDLSASVNQMVGDNKTLISTWKDHLKSLDDVGTYTVVGLGSKGGDNLLLKEGTASEVRNLKMSSMGGTQPLTKNIIEGYSNMIGGHTDLIYYTDADEYDEYGLAAETVICESCEVNQATHRYNPLGIALLCGDCLEDVEATDGFNMIPPDKEYIGSAETFNAEKEGVKFELLPSVYIEGVGIVSEGSPYLKNNYNVKWDDYNIYDDDAAEVIFSIPANDPKMPLQEGELGLITAMVYGFNHPLADASWGELNERGMFWAAKTMEELANYDPYEAEEFGAQTEAKRALKLLRRKSSKQRTQNRKQARSVKGDKYGSEERAETDSQNGFMADARYGAGATFGVIGALFTGGFLMSLLGRRS